MYIYGIASDGELKELNVTDDIIFIEIINKKIQFHTASGVYRHLSTLRDLYQLVRSKDYIRAEKNILVNMSQAVDLDDKNLEMSNGKVLFLSRRAAREAKLFK